MTSQKTLILNGLSCANCAAKIEAQINSLPEVHSANVDFISKKLFIKVHSAEDLSRVLEKSRNIAHKIEDGLTITEEGEHKEHTEKDFDLAKIIRLSIGAVLFAVGLIFDFSQTTELGIFSASYLLVGADVIFIAVKDILKGQFFNENFLMSIATIGAFAIKEYPEGVAVMLFYQVGELFQDYAVNRSRKSITALMDIFPDYANLKIGDEIKKVSPSEVKIDDIIIVKPGERIPLDGIVTEGSSMVDTSALTGESVPRETNIGDDVLSGYINQNGVLTVKVKSLFENSTVAKILDLVQNASAKKAPTENFITKFARYYTPSVVLLAVGLAFLPPIFIEGANFYQWINRSLVFLVVSCPCALVISIPLGFFSGIGRASKNGILIKGGNYLEALNNVDTVVFDKTGTLTKGVFKVIEINGNDISKELLLEYASYAESFSNHPIALSIMQSYGKAVDQSKISDYKELPGLGISVRFNDKVILAGNEKLMNKEGILFKTPENYGTIIHIAINGEYGGSIIIADEIKNDSAKAIKSLKAMGVKKTVMLTGDNKTISEKIAKDLGLDGVFAELLPAQKVEKLEMLFNSKETKGNIVFVGDGINDAPVLARSDIGVAMGGIGSDAAIEAADVVLMTDEPTKLAEAIKIAKITRRIILQNIVFALVIKGIVLLMGAVGVATMWEAVFADVGVSLIAIINAMRIMKFKG